jgi:hypothetical protein
MAASELGRDCTNCLAEHEPCAPAGKLVECPWQKPWHPTLELRSASMMILLGYAGECMRTGSNRPPEANASTGGPQNQGPAWGPSCRQACAPVADRADTVKSRVWLVYVTLSLSTVMRLTLRAFGLTIWRAAVTVGLLATPQMSKSRCRSETASGACAPAFQTYVSRHASNISK